MKFPTLQSKHYYWGLLLLALVLCGAGCASTDTATNTTGRPWNSSEGWQNGVLSPYANRPH